MPAKKAILTGFVTVLGVGGLITGAYLVRQRQNLERSAAVPGGRAEVRILPTGGSFDIGQTIPVSVYFNTDGVPVNGIIVRLTYPYSASTPEVTASNIAINPTLLGTGNWSCPTQTVDENFGNVIIDISCADISASGYSTTTDTLLATFSLTVNQKPTASPFTVRFDPSNSSITQKSNGQDILGIPDSTGSYAIGGAVIVPTTSVSPTAVITSAITTTTTLSPSPTSVFSTTTPTPTKKVATSSPNLPDAGTSLPTIVGLGLGLLAIFGSLAFAL